MTASNGVSIPTSASALAAGLPGILSHLDGDGAKRLDAYQATIATAILRGRLIDRPSKVTGIRGKALVYGTVADTVVKLYKIAKDAVAAAKVEVASLTLAHGGAEGLNVAGTLSAVAGAVDLATGDLLYLEVTTASTGGSDMFVEAVYESVTT